MEEFNAIDFRLARFQYEFLGHSEEQISAAHGIQPRVLEFTIDDEGAISTRYI